MQLMNQLKRIPPRMIPLVIAGTMSLVLLLALLIPHKPGISPLVGKKLPDFMLPRLDAPQKRFMPADMLKTPAVLNVFASWCVPCKAEHPLLMQLAGRVRVYGISWRDTPEKTAAYIQANGNPYQITGVDSIPITTVMLGIQGVPTTYVVDAQGVVRGKWDMPLTQDIIDKQVLPLLQQIEAPHAP